MGIVVKHGNEGGTTAGQIIARAGQGSLQRQHESGMLAQRLGQQRDMQMQQIEAQAGRQKQAADDAMAKTALKHGLDGELRENEFDRELQKMQAQAKNKANQWEYEYTGKQRQELAKFNNARQQIEDSDNWSPEEKTAALRAIDLKQANIKPSMMPRDPSKPQYPEGQGIGDSWKDDSGATITRTAEGERKLLVRPDQTKEYMEAKGKAAYDLKMLDVRVKLATEEIDEIGEDGQVKGSRYRTPAELSALMQSVTGRVQAGQEQQQPPRQQEQPQQTWWEQASAMGLNVTESDMKLPREAGLAQATFRQMTAEYGSREQVPKKALPAYDKAVKTLIQHSK